MQMSTPLAAGADIAPAITKISDHASAVELDRSCRSDHPRNLGAAANGHPGTAGAGTICPRSRSSLRA